MVRYIKALFDEKEPGGMGPNFGSNYTTSYKRYIGGGIALRTSVQFGVLKIFWLEPAFYTNINTQHTTYSGNLFINLDIPAGYRKS